MLNSAIYSFSSPNPIMSHIQCTARVSPHARIMSYVPPWVGIVLAGTRVCGDLPILNGVTHEMFGRCSLSAVTVHVYLYRVG